MCGKKIIIIFCLPPILAVVMILSVPLLTPWLDHAQRDRAERQAAYALYQADHKQILADGRGYLRQVAGPHGQILPADPRWKELPDSIRAIEPVYVWTGPQWLRIAIIGGFIHMGLRITPTDSTEPQSDEILLLPGLFYYDDGLREAPNYRQHLEELRAKYPPK